MHRAPSNKREKGERTGVTKALMASRAEVKLTLRAYDTGAELRITFRDRYVEGQQRKCRFELVRIGSDKLKTN